jgi:hypothetical protein
MISTQLKKYWHNKPLISIIVIALILRLLAAFFSQGYAMHDDHFLVIEASQSWADGTDYNNWLPESQKALNPDIEPIPSGHSLFYCGVHFVFFKCLQFIGINDPKNKMLIIRIIHALLSLIIVVMGYKITLKLTNEKNARQVGLLLAVLWVIPFLSVRNLVEVVCIPFLMLGCWYLLIADSKKNPVKYILMAGLITGIAFSIRFQTAFFIIGMGLYLLITRKFKSFSFFCIGVIISILVIQGIVDMIIWHRPFAEFTEYVRYNIEHKYDYGANQLEMYFLILMGLTIPPIGFFLFFGFLRTWKKYAFLFLPSILFFAFHLYFPNKQERFILPIFTFFIMLGIIGWNEWVEKSKFWEKWPGLLKGCWIFFWIVNLVLLPVFTLSYSKKSRAEGMYYFYKKEPVKRMLVEDTNRGGVLMLPNYYTGQWIKMFMLSKPDTTDSAKFGEIKNDEPYYKYLYNKQYFLLHPENRPEYAIFIGDKRLEERVTDIKSIFPNLTFAAKAEPSFVDKVMQKLNPANKNEPLFIYKTN